MNNYAIQIEVPEGRVKEILDKLSDAQTIIRECYDELEHLGILTVTRKASGNQ